MLTQERLKEVLSYDPETGEFAWIKRNGNVAGYTDLVGYTRVMVDKKSYLSHRLVWLYTHGYFPEHQIDHLNGVKDDNRLSNLREVSRGCNLQNLKLSCKNTSGFPGVYRTQRPQRWKAQARVENKLMYLGYYNSKLDAALARLTWEVWCPAWTCNHRGELVKAIKKEWPEFNLKSIE